MKSATVPSFWELKNAPGKRIVASVSVERMCTDLGVHKETVRNWTNALHKRGIIRKLKERCWEKRGDGPCCFFLKVGEG